MRCVCVHCEQPIKTAQAVFQYPVSRCTAHRDCVSIPSIDAMDVLLVARQAAIALRAAGRDRERSSNTRRVYSTDRPGIVDYDVRDNTRTGRVSSNPAKR